MKTWDLCPSFYLVSLWPGKVWPPHSNFWEQTSRKKSIQQRDAGSASETEVVALCVRHPLAHHLTQRKALIGPVLCPTTQELCVHHEPGPRPA